MKRLASRDCQHAIALLCLLLSVFSLSVAAATPPTTRPYPGKPYGQSPHAIPGVIQAVQYDIAPDAANDITFHYSGGAKKTDLRTTNDGIGLARFGRGHVTTTGQPEDPQQTYLGWTQTGQWMKYTVRVNQAATYRFGGHFAVARKDARLSLVFSPSSGQAPIKAGPVSLPTTADFQPGVEVYHVWETLDNLAEITLPAGDYILTITLDNAGGANLNAFTFTIQK